MVQSITRCPVSAQQRAREAVQSHMASPNAKGPAG